jgi:glucose/arabinose dehydrogenase
MSAAIALHASVTLTTFRSFQEASVKKIVLALAVAVATAAAANAQTAAKAPADKAAAAKPAAAQAHPAKAHTEKAAPMKAEVVSTDATAKTITVKDASGSNVTLTATGAAVSELAKVKAGDWVMVTKSENNATKITKVKDTATKAPHKEKK